MKNPTHNGRDDDAPRGQRPAPAAASRGQERSAQVSSVIKAFGLLETIAAAGGLSLSELSRRTDLHPSTAHRLLQTLIGIGYVKQEPASRRYMLGPRSLSLGRAAPPDAYAALQQAAEPQLRRLAEAVGETVNLYVLDGAEVLHLAQSEAPTAIRMFARVGMRMPAYCTAAGKVLLANLPPPARAERVAGLSLAPHTPNTIVDRDDLLVELDRIRRRGYAVDDEEQELGVRCVAAALRGPSGEAVAAISISGPTGRINVHHIADLAQRVQEAAAQISHALR